MKDDDIHIAITTERKQRWQKFVEENPDISSLTELVRRGVTDLIERHESAGTNDPFEVDLEPVLAPIHNIEGGMEEVLRVLRDLDDQIETQDDIAELAESIYPFLPEAATPAELDAARRELDDDASTKELAMTTGAAHHFAELYDKDIVMTIDALNHLEVTHDEVKIYSDGDLFEAFKAPENTESDV